MGKYHDIKSNPDNDKEWFLQIIANELAEANRLKRIELWLSDPHQKLGGKDLEDRD